MFMEINRLSFKLKECIIVYSNIVYRVDMCKQYNSMQVGLKYEVSTPVHTIHLYN